jgi:pyruvate-formate lyase-activating enzyme
VKTVLFINPWIYDFAALDDWVKPIGLLYLTAHFRRAGYQTHLIDCLDRHNPALLAYQQLQTPRNRTYGIGKFFREPVSKPEILQHIPENYCRYGIPEDIFLDMLETIPPPDAVLVTSIMTYWYPGAFRVIELVKRRYPNIPVILGGIYARLCPQHARAYSRADYVLTDDAPGALLQKIAAILGETPPLFTDAPALFDVYPAFDLYPRLDYACLMTSQGCPYRCTYCASHALTSQFVQRHPGDVFRELLHDYETLGVRHFAFYDDALVVRATEHLEPLLQHILGAKLALTFHTPNGLHARCITESSAELMFRSGFKTIRIGLETIEPTRQHHTGGNVTGDELAHAVKSLKQAGFKGSRIGVYLFIGLPGQTLRETKETIAYIHALGVQAHLCEYSPIPGTRDWSVLEQQGDIRSDDDPLIQNNSIFIFHKQRIRFADMQSLKNWVRSLNSQIKAAHS